MNTPLRVSAFVFLGLSFLGFSLAIPTQVYAASTIATTSSNHIFEESLIHFVNYDRVIRGRAPLATSSLLDVAAQKKANDMMTNGYFAHYSPYGVSPWHWFTEVGYYFTHAGENLAMNFYTPKSVEAAWMASPAHRANVLRSLYTQIGLGIAHGTYEGKPTTFIVELFATPVADYN